MKFLFTLITSLFFTTAVFADEPVVTGVQISEPDASGKHTFHVSVKHADTGWDHYADNFEILSPDGTILATRVLHHPHVNEQPFTRSKSGVVIPKGLKEVDVRAHDSVHGYGPTVRVELP
ncbi:hypothetical protein RYZ26_11145 [Terasakiella sp. A23]|uniref:hypothetical protein n=1 Tax=Terasakiella sp. FCG-A23 TaxID=3080561 RepID=UPI00295479CA|nr:hypothetical protein [Terasakiella sp. A23]MDV7340152.1 hypothetical protein [Terasakiella sp. A23]